MVKLPNSVKRWIFWIHLTAGMIAALFIFTMSATGVLLTYERQIKELAEMSYAVEPEPDRQRITTDRAVAILQELHPKEPHIYVRWVNRDGAAVPAWAGPNSYLLHPYSGEILRVGEGAVAEFFHIVTDLHRYLLLDGDYRSIGKALNNYANLAFIFLILSGLYLWLPKRLSLRSLRSQSWLPKRYKNAHHRNRQWHFVFGIWSLPALFVIAVTATLFHFDWANKALYGFYGETVPVPEKHEPVTSLAQGQIAYEKLFERAKHHAKENDYGDWYSMWMEIGEHPHEARFYIDKSIGHRQELAYSLFFDSRTGQVTDVLRKEDWSMGDQAWGTARFLHTGEYFGIVGQTLAGLASLLACILVYTGFVLGLRRIRRN